MKGIILFSILVVSLVTYSTDYYGAIAINKKTWK